MDVSYRVLVVDDDDLNREVMEAFLSLNGYTVTITGTGKRAVELCRRQKPNLIILDLRLPDISGIEVCEIIRADSSIKNIPILMITGMSDPEVRQQALSAGVTRYMQRPFDGDDFVEEVKAILLAN